MDTNTMMYGVFGDPVGHSKSPLMLNHAFEVCQINAAYAAFHIVPGALKSAVEGIRALGFRGVNVTIPHKLEVMDYLDEIDETARQIGAVNTIVNEAGTLIGYNTDGIGYVRSLKEETGFEPQGKRMVIIGSGGAARSVVYALAKEQPELIVIANRTKDKAVELADNIERLTGVEVRGIALTQVEEAIRSADYVLNTTRIGMQPHTEETPIQPDLLHPGVLVSDIVYTPMKTKLLKEAETRGCRIHGGLGMFIYQGAYAFEYWTGRKAPVAAMRDVVERTLE